MGLDGYSEHISGPVDGIVSLSEYAPEVYIELTQKFDTAAEEWRSLSDIAVTVDDGLSIGAFLTNDEACSVYYNETGGPEGISIPGEAEGQWFTGGELVSAAHVGPRASFNRPGDYSNLEYKRSLMLFARDSSGALAAARSLIGLCVSRKMLPHLYVTPTDRTPTDEGGQQAVVFNAVEFNQARRLNRRDNS